MKKIKVTVEYAENNYAAYIEILPGCVATGNTFEKLQQNMKEALELHLETSREFGDYLPEEFNYEFNLIYKFDPESLLTHYKGIFTNAAFERITGINQRQLQRYSSGKSKPMPIQREKIIAALHDLGRELLNIEL